MHARYEHKLIPDWGMLRRYSDGEHVYSKDTASSTSSGLIVVGPPVKLVLCLLLWFPSACCEEGLGPYL